MSAASGLDAPDREFLALTYFELAYLLSESTLRSPVVRRVLPLPDETDAAENYLARGSTLLAVRRSVLADDRRSYDAALSLLVDGIARSTSVVSIAVGGIESEVVAAFRGDDLTVELLTLPGGQMLLGALRTDSLEDTVVAAYLVERGFERSTLLASREDGVSLWMSCSGGVVQGTSGDSFDTNANGPDWNTAVHEILTHAEEFLVAEPPGSSTPDLSAE